MNSKNVEALRKLVAVEITANPVQLDGFAWCALPQSDLAAALGCSVETVRRIIQKPPFVRDCALIGGKRTLLLREGDPDAMTPRHIARILEKVWRETTNQPNAKGHFGLFNGLAKDWPDGFQVELLKFVLADWPGFMAVVRDSIVMAEIDGELEGKPVTLYKRFYRYPSIIVLRRFWQAAIEAYETHLQGHDVAKFVAFAKAVAAKSKPPAAT